MSIPPRLHIVPDAEPTRRLTPAELSAIFPPLRSQAELDAMPRPGVSVKLRRYVIASVLVVILTIDWITKIIVWSATK